MPSLDGYSLNEKMDKNTDRIDNDIKQVRNKVEMELNEMNLKFNELQSYIKTIKAVDCLCKPVEEKECQEKKPAVTSKAKQKKTA